MMNFGIDYMMYLHELMYGTPYGPVCSDQSIISERWDLYRLFRKRGRNENHIL